MLTLMGKKICTILCSNILFIQSYGIGINARIISQLIFATLCTKKQRSIDFEINRFRLNEKSIR